MRQLSLALLGAFEVSRDGQPLTGFETLKARALLAYLAMHAERAQPRETLATLLWPEASAELARTYLRQALANLREVLDERTADVPTLLITRDTVQFNPGAAYDLDVTEFRALLAACAQHPHRRAVACTTCARRREQALSLYRSSFLDQFYVRDSAPFEEWAALTREALHQDAVTALAHVADYHERRGDYATVERLARQQLALDPWREEAHQQLMRALALNGQRSAALEQYERCRRVLASELGVEPATETTALYERIRDTARAELSAQNVEHLRVQNFPAQTTALIGRERELMELGEFLENPACRLITLVGPGGIGKTRLALAAAEAQAGVFADGTAFVPLAGINTAQFVAPTILAVLDIVPQGQREPRDQLVEYLRGKELLLLLDNVEQLLAPTHHDHDGIADLLSEIQERAPRLTLLVTSRERLALPSEWLFDVPGLSYPAGEQTTGVDAYSAVRLFVQRAGQVRRQFAPGSSEAHAVARICQLVEGLPLAIELAAAAVRTRSCIAIVAAIERNLSALATERRAVPERHRSMWATFEHSWRLLSEGERGVLARLSVFRGGFEEDAAAHVAHASPELLASLVDKSLLRWNGVVRYDLHELVRQYASEKLQQAGEIVDTQQRHARYFLHVVEAAEHVQSGPVQREALELFECELENLRAAFAWALESGDSELCLRLATAPARFWGLRTPMQEGYQWLAAALAHNEAQYQLTGSQAPPAVRAGAMLAQVEPAIQLGHRSDVPTLLEQALRLYTAVDDKPGMAAILTWQATMDWDGGGGGGERLDQALEMARAGNDPGTLGHVLGQIGFIALFNREYGTARTALNEALAIFRAQGNTWGVAEALENLAGVARDLRDFARANELYQEAVVLASEGGETIRRAWVLHGWGEAALLEGDYAAARTREQESLMLFRQVGHTYGIAHALHNLGYAEQHLGDTTRTVACFSECLRLFRALEEAWGIPASLFGLGGVAVMYAQQLSGEARLEQARRAARLLGAADGLNVARGMVQWPAHQAELEHNLAAARALLAPEVFEATWAEGRGMTLEQAVAYALDNTDVH